MLVRCSAAFALVSHQQANPPASAAVQNARLMSERAREFFVISSARVMDEAALSREQISAVLRKEAQALSQGNALEQILPPCLQMLRASGL